MKLYEWFKVFLYIFLWIFIWTLVDRISHEYGLTNKEIIKICSIGLIFIIIILQLNPSINLS